MCSASNRSASGRSPNRRKRQPLDDPGPPVRGRPRARPRLVAVGDGDHMTCDRPNIHRGGNRQQSRGPVWVPAIRVPIDPDIVTTPTLHRRTTEEWLWQRVAAPGGPGHAWSSPGEPGEAVFLGVAGRHSHLDALLRECAGACAGTLPTERRCGPTKQPYSPSVGTTASTEWDPLADGTGPGPADPQPTGHGPTRTWRRQR